MKETGNNNTNAPEDTHENRNEDLKRNNNNENNNNIIQKEDNGQNEENVDEKTPLKEKEKKNEELIKILNNLYDTLNTKENETKELVEIYGNYLDDENDKDNKQIKDSLSIKDDIIVRYIIGAIQLIINLVGIFTIKSIMDTLFDVFFDGLKYFIYKKSELQEYNLTDYKSRYLSSYNFYERFFEHISDNEVEFDLMMFWDFVGMFLQKYCGYRFTYIICFFLSCIFLVLIFGFDYLDIDDSSHKYSFFQLLFLILVYLFLWIVVSSLSLLTQQKYINRLYLFLKKKKKDIKIKQQKKEEEEKQRKQKEEGENNKKQIDNIGNNDSAIDIWVKSKQLDKTSKLGENKEVKDESEDVKVEYIFFPILISIIFLAFLINHSINRKIYKYKIEKMTEIYLTDKNEVYNKMYSKEKKIFLYYVCLPYIGEMIISLLIYFDFDETFTETKKETEINENKKNVTEINENKKNVTEINENKKNEINNTETAKKENKAKAEEIKEGVNENEEKNEENQINKEIIIKKVSIKKLCGYLIFKQKIIEKKEISNKENKGLTRKIWKNFLNCFKLLFISIKDCVCSACCCNCCKSRNNSSCCSSCSYNENSFKLEERNFCLCLQEKRKLKWFYDTVNSSTHKRLVKIILFISYCQLFILGFEEIYDEKNENYKNINQRQRDIILPLVLCFLISLVIFVTISLDIYDSFIRKVSKKSTKNNKNKTDSQSESEDDDDDSLLFMLAGIILLELIIYIVSLWYSIKYLKSKKSVYNGKGICYPIFLNKFSIFMLYYFLAEENEKYEVFTNSSLVAFYTFISELILYAIKALFSIKVLIIIQIVGVGLPIVFFIVVIFT